MVEVRAPSAAEERAALTLGILERDMKVRGWPELAPGARGLDWRGLRRDALDQMTLEMLRAEAERPGAGWAAVLRQSTRVRA